MSISNKKTQFKLEGLYIILILLSINVLQGLIRGDSSDHVIISIGVIAIFSIYYLLRKVFSGIEYPDIATKRRYRKKRQEVSVLWMASFIIFMIANIVHKIFFQQDRSWIDIIAISSLFLIILYFIDYFSLKKSYKKNKSLTDDID